MSNNRKNGGNRFKCKNEAQKRAIRRYYAEKAAKKKCVEEEGTKPNLSIDQQKEPVPSKKFSDRFPFWARLKISKSRTTLVIDEDTVWDKQRHRDVEGYVHREATSRQHNGFEEIKPNPDKDKDKSMFLKPPRKLPKRLFSPHNKNLDMPEYLKERYDKNNDKGKNDK